MKKYASLTALAFTLISPQANVLASEYGKASEIKSARQGESVIRYIKEYESPCLLVQVLDPNKQWGLLVEKVFCSYDNKSFITDVSYAAFKNISFGKEGINVELEIIPLDLNEGVVHICTIPVRDSIIKELSCTPSK